MADKKDKGSDRQLRLPLNEGTGGPGKPLVSPHPLRVIQGEGKRRDEKLESRDDVVRLLVGSACDLMLKRISPDRAHEIQRRVDRIMRLFEKVDGDHVAMVLLRRELDDLEKLYREGQDKRPIRK